MGITVTWLNQKIASGKIATAERLSDGIIRPYGALSNIRRRASVEHNEREEMPIPSEPSDGGG